MPVLLWTDEPHLPPAPQQRWKKVTVPWGRVLRQHDPRVCRRPSPPGVPSHYGAPGTPIPSAPPHERSRRLCLWSFSTRWSGYGSVPHRRNSKLRRFGVLCIGYEVLCCSVCRRYLRRVHWPAELSCSRKGRLVSVPVLLWTHESHLPPAPQPRWKKVTVPWGRVLRQHDPRVCRRPSPPGVPSHYGAPGPPSPSAPSHVFSRRLCLARLSLR